MCQVPHMFVTDTGLGVARDTLTDHAVTLAGLPTRELPQFVNVIAATWTWWGPGRIPSRTSRCS